MADSTHPPSEFPTTERPAVDVVVVGAGISGLATADALTRTGTTVTVLEARSRTGGRLLSTPLDPAAFRAAEPSALDLGATWFWDGEHRVLALTRRLNLATFPQHLAGDTIVEDLRGVQRYAGNVIDSPAHRYTGGASTLTDALAAALPSGAVQLDHPVEWIGLAEPNGTSGTSAAGGTRQHGLEVTARGRTWRARHVVLALPPAVAVDTIRLPAQLPAEVTRLAAATPVWMGQAVKVVAVYDEPFWRRDGLAGAAASRPGPLQEIHDMSGPHGQPAALFGFAPAALIGADADRQVRDQLTRMFGPRAAEPRQLTIQNWSTEKWTNPAPSQLADPGASSPAAADYSLFGHPYYQRPDLNGRLHWASTETATAYAGHVEGALEAAERTVAAIQTDLDLHHPHKHEPDTTRSDRPRPDQRKAAS